MEIIKKMKLGALLEHYEREARGAKLFGYPENYALYQGTLEHLKIAEAVEACAGTRRISNAYILGLATDFLDNWQRKYDLEFKNLECSLIVKIKLSPHDAGMLDSYINANAREDVAMHYIRANDFAAFCGNSLILHGSK